MNDTTPQPLPEKQGKFEPLTADQLTPALIEEAVAQARRFDRNFANREGTDAIPVPARMCRLLALTIIHLHDKLAKGGRLPVGKALPTEEDKVAKASKAAAPKSLKKEKPAVAKALKKPAKPVAKKSQPGPALTEEQRKAFDTVKDILGAKEVVTTRRVAELGGWKSHNTGARHISSLIDLGYLKKVGKQQVIALTGLEP